MSFYRLGRFNKQKKDNRQPFMIFHCHSKEPIVEMEDHSLIGVFIDPGVKNYCLRICRRYNNGHVETILQKKLNLTTYLGNKFDTVVHVKNKIKESLTDSSIIYEDNEFNLEYESDDENQITDKKTKKDCKNNLSTKYFTNLYNFFDLIKDHLINSHYIVIESQMLENYEASRIQQHTISYMMTELRDQGLRPVVVEISSKLKTRNLGATGKMKKRDNKQFCVNAARQIIDKRGDKKMLEVLNAGGKLDDHSDVICMDYIWWELICAKKTISRQTGYAGQNICVRQTSRFVEESIPARSSRFVEESIPARSSRFVEESIPTRPSRFVEESIPKQSSRFVEESIPPRSSRFVEESIPTRPSRFIEESCENKVETEKIVRFPSEQLPTERKMSRFAEDSDFPSEDQPDSEHIFFSCSLNNTNGDTLENTEQKLEARGVGRFSENVGRKILKFPIRKI